MGTPFFHPGPTCGMQVLPWAQHAEKTDALNTLAGSWHRGSTAGEASWEDLRLLASPLHTHTQ